MASLNSFDCLGGPIVENIGKRVIGQGRVDLDLVRVHLNGLGDVGGVKVSREFAGHPPVFSCSLMLACLLHQCERWRIAR